jgi:hypothetical protein
MIGAPRGAHVVVQLAVVCKSIMLKQKCPNCGVNLPLRYRSNQACNSCGAQLKISINYNRFLLVLILMSIVGYQTSQIQAKGGIYLIFSIILTSSASILATFWSLKFKKANSK